jgi:hypothetical protein
MKALTKAKGNLARQPASATFSIVERVVDTNITAPALVSPRIADSRQSPARARRA